MSPGRNAVGRARAIRALFALIAVFACIGAVAYAATRPAPRDVGLGGSKPVEAAPLEGGGGPQGKKEESLLQPRFIEYPEAFSVEPEVQFRFHVPPRQQERPGPSQPGPAGEVPRPRPFQCRLDGGSWRSCSSPYRLSGLAVGGHALSARAFNRDGKPGPVISYAWQRVEPSPRAERVDANEEVDSKPFSVELQGQLEDLYPGYPAQELPVLIANPNPMPIEITSLTVAIAAEPPQCPAENFELSPSNASAATPIAVPANGSVTLPTATVSAPAISMLNLPVNQDACRSVDVPLVFDGEAHG
jgi:hypothetical protein